jgi:hypothetical protein
MFFRRALRGAVAAIGLALMSLPAFANPFIIGDDAPQPGSEYRTVFALRYWYGFGRVSKDLYDFSGDTLLSRLTYDGMQSHSAEAFVRVDHSGGLFWKGFAGGGLLTQGNLQDEDFPPGITPYSSTNSTLQNQALGYLATDFGGALVRGGDFRVDAFAGYFYMHERMKAFGCQQTATNLLVCVGSIPDSVAVIVEDDTWQAVRLGLNADIPLADRWRLNLEAAWLPYVWFNGTDNHLLRPDLPGPVPEDGTGWGYQLEALVSYRVNDSISLGIGGRYWHMQSHGYAHFEDILANGGPQVLDFQADHYGAFLQGTWHFGPD